MTATRWHAAADAEALARDACARICAAATAAIALRGDFHLVLAGGNTPRATYELLRAADADWARWHIYYGDERCLPADDPARNSVMAAHAWLDHVAIPTAQRHTIPAERGVDAAAAAYARTLQAVGAFDLVLLGLGEDGHTASLFPGHDWGTHRDAPAVLAVHAAPKPPPERVSLGAARLSHARAALFLVAGAVKRGAVDAWRRGDPMPARAIRLENGVDVLAERALLA